MKVICCQWNLVWENKKANFEKVSALLDSAKPEPETLIVLPEMFSTGFSMDVARTAQGDPPETEEFLAGLARKWKSHVLGGVVTKALDGRGLNQSVTLGPDGVELARYTKIQPFNLGGEGDHYAAGSEIVTYAIGDWTLSPFVCYDLRFPEIFRLAARHGVQVYTVIASWPDKRIHHWVNLLQARAIENQAYVIGVNRCGSDPYFTFNGRTLIVGPGGDILADAGDKEGCITATLDREQLDSLRSGLPFLKDMRPEFLAGAQK